MTSSDTSKFSLSNELISAIRISVAYDLLIGDTLIELRAFVKKLEVAFLEVQRNNKDVNKIGKKECFEISDNC